MVGLLIVVLVGLIVEQLDLGMVLLVVGVGVFVLFFLGMLWWCIGVLLGVVVVMVLVGWYFMYQYQCDCVMILFNLEFDLLGNGWYIIQLQIVVGFGGVFGKGWQYFMQLWLDFLFEYIIDFIFVVFFEEFGLVGVIGILVLYVFIIGCCLWIVMEVCDIYLCLFVGVIGMSFFVYVLVNGGMVVGMLLVVGVLMLLVSYGGILVVLLFIGFGVLMLIYVYCKMYD